MIRSEHPHLAHEAAYLFLLSRIGEHLDEPAACRACTRSALAGPRGAICVLLPSGGGKSTLAVSALSDERVADPGRGHAAAGRPRLRAPVPAAHRRQPDRRRADAARARCGGSSAWSSTTSSCWTSTAFAIASKARPSRWPTSSSGSGRLARDGRLERLPRRAAAGALLREGVVGVGVYQGMEFVLQRGMRDVAGKAGEALARARCCAAARAAHGSGGSRSGATTRSNWDALGRCCS